MHKQIDDFERQQELFNEERKKFQEEAIKMGLERSDLQKQRDFIENQLKSKEHVKLSNNLPQTPSWLRKPASLTPQTFTPINKLFSF